MGLPVYYYRPLTSLMYIDVASERQIMFVVLDARGGRHTKITVLYHSDRGNLVAFPMD
jgi:hypothetical protein